MNMRKILYILAALTLLAAAGCKKEEKKVDYKALISGEWHCSPADIETDVHAVFEADGCFDAYQKIGEGRYRHYTGTWSSEGSTLSGIYSDGSAWGSTYRMEFPDDNTMTLTALNGSEEVMTYFREAVPAEVKEGCIDVKSSLGILNSQPQYRWL